MHTPLVTDIRRLSLDDGPGLRSVVFLKGCPLACSWCHNPEAISPDPELMVATEACRGCGDCVAACPAGAVVEANPPIVDRARCQMTGDCAAGCPSGALRIVGRRSTVDELVTELLRDRVFYETSQGGVTFSGGEPVMFPEYLGAVAQRLRSEAIHVAIETSGAFVWEAFAALVAPFVDLVMFDLKLFDPGAHRHYVGSDNERLLANFVRLCETTSIEVVPRTPLVPGITDEEDNLMAIAEFVAGRRCRRLVLLPYNPAGIAKRRALGRPIDPALRDGLMTPVEIARAEEIVTATCAG